MPSSLNERFIHFIFYASIWADSNANEKLNKGSINFEPRNALRIIKGVFLGNEKRWTLNLWQNIFTLVSNRLYRWIFVILCISIFGWKPLIIIYGNQFKFQIIILFDSLVKISYNLHFNCHFSFILNISK